MSDLIGFILIFTFLIPVIPAILVIVLYVLLSGSSSGSNFDTQSSNYYSNTDYPKNENNSGEWQLHVDQDDKEYDSFGSYGTEDDLDDWDEDCDF